MVTLHLYWKRNGKDIDLGLGYLRYVPQLGTLLRHLAPDELGVMWRIVEVIHTPAAAGSMTYMAMRDGRRADDCLVDVFVVPAEGPFEP